MKYVVWLASYVKEAGGGADHIKEIFELGLQWIKNDKDNIKAMKAAKTQETEL